MARKSRFKKISNEVFTARVTQLNHEGRGVAHIHGKATFVFGALPTETVQCKYTKLHRQYDEATAVAILEKSPDRVTPLCRHFGICGGCSLQHMNSTTQRAHKQAVLLEHFQHQANTQPTTVLEPLYGNVWEYRRRARLSVKYVEKKNAVLVGFHERSARFVADIHQCEILHPSIGKKIKALGELLMQLEKKAHIAQCEIAIGDNASAVIIRNLTELPKSDLEKLILFAQENQLQFYLQPGNAETISPLYPSIPEKLFYTIPDYHLTLYFQPAQFTQINQEINLKMIARVIELLDLQKSDHVLDLFCGIGNFSLPIAKHCTQVVGIEGSNHAVQQAKINATENKIENVAFHTHDLSAELPLISWMKTRYDKLLLDPPRVGATEIMHAISTWLPQRIVYVSCNPITLARDAKDLLQLGYRLEKAGVMDMFPHTDHIEAIALFIRPLA
ncbi:MAG: hypothetical protein ACD_42C00470G0001 [uncultured bacterium]|nr:MAG: hypothetical protein ACD_42C00470G0001 [uncultured bacterium]OGT33886.1 MAG: hypothetical protein A3C44_02490 [Gammaproteobacteria bacterium RIFCSPHIGHO2_02_FULL_39_13]OGT50137.1 MAG: hypothetical protein A3E53_01795 [Gammaproteobacteria bacterium RIFCSPHIGHO2_12_FULL_39_24]